MTRRVLAIVILLTASVALPLKAGTVEVGVDLIVRDSNLHPRASGSVAYKSLWGYYTNEPVAYNVYITGTYAADAGSLITPYSVSVEAPDPVEAGNCYQGVIMGTADDSAQTASSSSICYAGPPSPPQCTLSILVSGSGSAGSGGSNQYACGVSVTATAQPGSGWQFSYWSGAVSGTDNPISFVLSSDMTITANFEQLPPPPLPDPGPQCGDADWQSGCSPIVIALGDGTYRLTGADDPVLFDIAASGVPQSIGWTAAGADEAFLALDRDHEGRIVTGAELFGTATPLRSGEAALNGFVALRELDANGDGIIDANDPIWAELVLWRDLNHNGRSEPDELQPIAQSTVAGISVDYHWSGRRDPSGNTFKYQGTVWLRTQSGGVRAKPVYDVFFVRAR